MSRLSAETERFLTAIDMHPAQTDTDAFIDAFLREMDAGLADRPSSLRMLPTFVSSAGVPAEQEPVIALDAGGTNLRAALLEFRNGSPLVLREERSSMPGSRGSVPAEAFFSALAEVALPFTRESSRIGFCFSYPAEIYPEGDGRIICLTKEVSVDGIEGRMVGQGLIDALCEGGVKGPLSCVVLNDTTAGLLGGGASLGLNSADGLAGLVLGTGCNSCFDERGTKIRKLPAAKDMIVNCESGNFAGAFRGRADERVDALSENPGAYLFEKMLSGVYLGRVVTQEAVLAAEAGLLSPAFADPAPAFTTVELDDFLRGKENRISALCSGRDRRTLMELTDSVFDRAAKLVCANVLSLCLHCGSGESGEHPFAVVAEGSTFYRSLLLRKKLEVYLADIAECRYGRHIAFCRAENATLTGAAFAALTR